MVVKEDLCAWFKNLQPRKRIDYMCVLLDMLLPLELRFIGTVLEDLAKKDFNCLRDAELKANIASNLENIDGDSERSRGRSFSLSNEIFRSRIHLSLALLHSNNTTCANVIFNILEKQFDYILNFLQNKEILEDVCSILTLACHHPAFQFYQRIRLGEVLKTVEARAHMMDDGEDNFHLPLPPSNARAYRPAAPYNRPPSHEYAEKAKIRFIQVKGSSKSKEEQQNKKGAVVYDVHTIWSNGETTQAFLKYKELQDIHHKLVNKFPEWQTHRASIPELPAHRKYREEQKEGLSNVNAYLSELLKAPAYVLESDILTQPLRSGKLVQVAMAMGNPGNISAHPYFHRVSLYQGGTQVLECKYPQDPYRMAPYTYPYPSLTFAPVSPRASHLSSSTNSPTSSRPSSPASNSKASVNHSKSRSGKTGNQQNLVSEESAPAADPILQLLRLCDLEKYSDNLSCYTFDQLLALSKEELGKAGLPIDAQVKLKSHLDQYKPQYINGVIERPGFTPMSDQLIPAQPIAMWPINPTQEAMLISGQPSSITHPPYHSVSSLPSPQSLATAGECSPANSEVCSPSLSPALYQSDSPQNSPNVARGVSGVTIPPSSALSLKSGRVLQVDSSGSEDDRVPGVEGTEILIGNQGYIRPQLSNSMPHISQTSGPPGFLDKKVNIMPNIHIPSAEPAVESGTPPGMVPTTSVAVTLMNGFMSDSNSFMPPNAPSVIPSRMLNTRAFKHAQPTHTVPARHQNIINMPGLDMSSQTLHTMNKNGNGLNPIMPSALPHYMLPPPIPVTQGSSLPGHPNLQANANSAPNPSGGQPSMPPVANETGNGMPVFPLMYVAHPNIPGTIHPHRIINTMANSTVVITTTQSHQTAPAPPPTSHSPSPVATVMSSDQMQGGYVPGNNEPLMESRQDGSSTTPPNMAQLPGKPGPNSGTPSPPLSNKQTSNMNCDSTAPPVFTPPLQPYIYPISGHSNGLITPMPPPLSYFHTSNPAYANGFNQEMYLHRFSAQLGGGQVPIHLYGNSIYPPHMHTTNSSLSNSVNSNSISISSNNGNISKSGCYNCGQAGHKAVDCKENTMDSMTKPFALNFNPNPKADPE